jgi:hypothetical protein
MRAISVMLKVAASASIGEPNEPRHLRGKAGCEHQGEPATLTQFDQRGSSAEIIVNDGGMCQIVVDVEEGHVRLSGLARNQQQTSDAAVEEVANEAVVRRVVSHNGAVQGEWGHKDNGLPRSVSELPKPESWQVENDPVRRRPTRLQQRGFS